MEILLGTQGLSGPLPYLTAVFEHLERLGHEVLVFAAEETRPEAEGLRVVNTERGLPLAPDVIYAQDAYSALLLADIYPLTPQVFALHDDRDELWLPPQLPAVIARVVVFDDRGAERARAASLVHEIVRLRRPVDTDRISPLAPLRDRPRAAVLHLEHLSDHRRGVVERACADVGIEARARRGLRGWPGPPDPRGDGVGRAAYVYGEEGGDGWVTLRALRAARSRRLLRPRRGERDRLRATAPRPRRLRPGDGPVEPRARPGPQRTRPRPGAVEDLRLPRPASRPGGRTPTRARPPRPGRGSHAPVERMRRRSRPTRPKQGLGSSSGSSPRRTNATTGSLTG